MRLQLTSAFLLVLLLVQYSSGFLSLPKHKWSNLDSKNGGTDCVACTLLVGMFWQYAPLHKVSFEKAMHDICSFFPTPINDGCNLLVDIEGPVVAKLLNEGMTPDAVCNSMKSAPCYQQTAVCRLYPSKPNMTDAQFTSLIAATREKLNFGPPALPKAKSWFCQYFPAICKIINNFSQDHTPIDDIDGDGFSDVATLRGTDWRGKDCNDGNKQIYPGRLPTDNDALVDSNCNGIYGSDILTGKTYEQMWCENTQEFGYLVIGDSAAAHFHLPPNWFNVSEIGNGTYDWILFAIENELDWPMLSGHTAFRNASIFGPTISGPSASIAGYLFDLNHCNHRDYQNLGVNGASSQNVFPWAANFSRNTSHDKPLLVNVALIGNDVCGSNPFGGTSPQDYYNGFKRIIEMVDHHVPKGSIMSTVGLVDGRVLWNSMWNRTHPVGAYYNDVTYQDVYDFLNCVDISPCAGWMNSNETIRNMTTAHAMALNAQLAAVVQDMQGNLTNIAQLHNFGALVDEILEAWVAQGGQTWELIEPMDGFHPNQLANDFEANYTWGLLQKMGILPVANPNNAKITAKFGNQGGF